MALIADLISIYILVLLARGILSWVVPPTQGGFVGELNHVLFLLTEPLLAPIRRIIGVHRMGATAIDWSLTVLILLLIVIRANI